jgi:hypothetical protein
MPLRELRGWSMLDLLSVGDETLPCLCSPLARGRPSVREERDVALGDWALPLVVGLAATGDLTPLFSSSEPGVLWWPGLIL